MKTELKRFASGVVLAIFLGSLFFSLYHLTFGMSMESPMSDCPYMPHEEVICPMNLFDHLTAWKSTFISLVPELLLLIGFVAAVGVVTSRAPNLLGKLRLWLLRIPIAAHQIHPTGFSTRPLQELFSSGILHPKLY